MKKYFVFLWFGVFLGGCSDQEDQGLRLELMGELDVSDQAWSHLELSGDRLALVGPYHLMVLDVSNPDKPSRITLFRDSPEIFVDPDMDGQGKVLIAEQTALVIGNRSPYAMTIDFSIPESPAMVERTELVDQDLLLLDWTRGESQTYAKAEMDQTARIFRLDHAQFDSVRFEEVYDLKAPDPYPGIELYYNLMFCNLYNLGELRAYNVNDQSKQDPVASIQVGRMLLADLAVDDGLVYLIEPKNLSGEDDVIHVLRYERSTGFEMLSGFVPDFPGRQEPVRVVGLYVMDGIATVFLQDRVLVLDVSNPMDPRLQDNFLCNQAAACNAKAVAYKDRFYSYNSEEGKLYVLKLVRS